MPPNPNNVQFEGDSSGAYTSSSSGARGLTGFVSKLFKIDEKKANTILVVIAIIALAFMVYFFQVANTTPERQGYHRDGTPITN